MSIKLLDNDLINKIAAGEVVEKPASVVKELVENSIDAGATIITIEIEQGGKKRISIKDNGCGISMEDAELSLKRHATSKISQVEDLFNINTMGFRGEALASISSVSRFEMFSKTKDESGVRIGINRDENNGSFFKTKRDIDEIGTTVNVEDLFFNVPARLSFLKSDQSEYLSILEVVESLSIIHPYISFSLIHNNKKVFDSRSSIDKKGSSFYGETILRKRLIPIFKPSILEDLIYVKNHTKYLDLEMLISKPGSEYSNSKNIMFFVNDRLVTNKNLKSVFLKGYQGYLMNGKYPVGVIIIKVDPSVVDVNVHPSKTQIRFQYEKETLSILLSTVRDFLREGSWIKDKYTENLSKNDNQIIPNIEGGSIYPTSTIGVGTIHYNNITANSKNDNQSYESYVNKDSKSYSLKNIYKKSDFNKILPPSLSFEGFEVSSKDNEALLFNNNYNNNNLNLDSNDMLSTTTSSSITTSKSFSLIDGSSKDENSVIQWEEARFIGSYHKCYLLFEYKDELMVIDQHAFHERILYEKLLKDKTPLKEKQQLLVYESLVLPKDLFRIATENKEKLEEYGFSIDIPKEGVIDIKEIPSVFSDVDIEAVFTEILENIEIYSSSDISFAGSEISKRIYETIACHAAVRSGEYLDEMDVKRIIYQAKEVGFYLNCPHGRNCIKFFNLSNVEKWFDR